LQKWFAFTNPQASAICLSGARLSNNIRVASWIIIAEAQDDATLKLPGDTNGPLVDGCQTAGFCATDLECVLRTLSAMLSSCSAVADSPGGRLGALADAEGWHSRKPGHGPARHGSQELGLPGGRRAAVCYTCA
jgi:hypothetical protein